LKKVLELEGFEGDVLGGEEQFAVEGAIGGAAVEGFFGGDANEIGIVVFLGDVGEDEVAGVGVKAFGVGEIFTDGVIGEVASAAEHALFYGPGVGSDLEHVKIVIGFEDHAIGFAEMDFHEFGHVAEIGNDSHFRAVGAEREANGVGGVVGDGEGVDVDVANCEVLAGVNGFNAVEALGESFRKNLLEGAEGGLGDVERSFPEAEGLRQAVAMIGVFVGDEDAVEMVDGALDGGEAGESFALAEAGVNEDAGAFRFEQGDVARAAGG
jgi:hypothetical protein